MTRLELVKPCGLNADTLPFAFMSHHHFVSLKGLEPSHLSIYGPQPYLSANFNTTTFVLPTGYDPVNLHLERVMS